MPTIAVSISKENNAWIRDLNRNVERSGLKIGISRIVNTILNTRRMAGKDYKIDLEHRLVIEKENEIEQKFKRKYLHGK